MVVRVRWEGGVGCYLMNILLRDIKSLIRETDERREQQPQPDTDPLSRDSPPLFLHYVARVRQG